MKKSFSLLLALIMLLSVFTVMPADALAAEAEEVTLSTTDITVKKYEQCYIDYKVNSNFNKYYASFESDNNNIKIYNCRNLNRLQVVGLNEGESKISVCLQNDKGEKKLIKTINVKIEKNESININAIKKQLKKTVTVVKGTETTVNVLNKSIASDTLHIFCELPKGVKKGSYSKIDSQTDKLGSTIINLKSTGTFTVKLYAMAYANVSEELVCSVTDNTTKHLPVGKKIYLGKIKVKSVANKASKLKIKNVNLRYISASVNKLNPLGSLWYQSDELNDSKVTKMGLRVYISDLINSYDKNSKYTIKVADRSVIKWGYEGKDTFLYAAKAGKTTVTIYQKMPKKKSKVKVGTVTINVAEPYTLADISDTWYTWMKQGENHNMSDDFRPAFPPYYNYKNDLYLRPFEEERIFVLCDKNAPSYDTYRVKYESLNTDYVEVEADGTLHWKKDPRELLAENQKSIPLITAKLEFVDGSKSEYTFVYDVYHV